LGTFAHSYVIANSTPEALMGFYAANGSRAFIYPVERDLCAICDDNDDEADLSLLTELSAQLQALALLGQVFDSSVFVGTLFDRGKVIDEYIDYPEYLASGGLAFGGSVLYLNRAVTIEQRAAEWAGAFGVSDQAQALADVIRQREEYLFAEDFHTMVLNSLLLPAAMVGARYIELEQAYNGEPEARKVLLHANASD
jgi:hypothetical protein